MTADTELHPVARDYVTRLTAAAQVLPADEAAELVDDISTHLRDALTGRPGEAEVRTVLDRLGTPHELVAAAGGAPVMPAPVPTPAPHRDRLGAIEIIALICLIGAELMFFLFPLTIPFWLTGVILLLVSGVWSGRQKAWGAAGLATGVPVTMILLFASPPAETSMCVVSPSTPQVCTSSGGWPGWAYAIVWGILVAYLCLQAYSVWRLSRRR
jgi:uncharacterized membrane protein